VGRGWPQGGGKWRGGAPTGGTSPGSEAAKKDRGRLAGSSSTSVPASTSCLHSNWYSSSEPLNQWTESGSQRATISSTQCSSFWLRVGGAFSVTATRPTPCGGTVRTAYRRPIEPAEPLFVYPPADARMRPVDKLTPARA